MNLLVITRKLQLASLAATVLFGPLAGFADELPVTDIVTVTNYLADTCSELRGTSNANVRVFTVGEAVASVDKVFAKATSDKFSADRLARMKRLLKENLAFVYSYDATVVDKPLVYRVDGKKAELPVGTAFSAFAYRERIFDGDIDPIDSFSHTASIHPRNCTGYVAWVSKTGGEVFNLDRVYDGEIDILPFPVRRLETDVAEGADAYEKREIELIADVEDVSFSSLEALNSTHVAGDSHGYRAATPVATYRVELIVRKVEKGSLDYDRIAFEVDPRKHGNSLIDPMTGWPFFRGMTLRVLLCREDDALKVVTVGLVLPYPPYSEAKRESLEYPSSRFALNPQAVALPKDAVATICVQYGDHTLAKFYSTTNDITGSFGSFSDYSRTVRVEVWTASEGANADYWRTAWFAERQDYGMSSARAPIVTVRNVEEGMDAETRLAFAWHDFILESRELAPVKTLSGFADFVNRHTVCKTCRKPHYRVVLSDGLKSRAVSFGKGTYGRALDLLKSVCERTGCTCTFEGTDVVLASELSDAEVSDMSLKGRLHILEKDGFASVVGADYAGIAFWGAGSALEMPHYEPYAFSRGEYATTGNGWRRKTEDGKYQYLAFDAAWWDADDGKSRNVLFHLSEAKTRLARDAAIVRAYLRDAAESPDDFEFRYGAVKNDAFALSFACHLQQLGRTEDAQSIYEALLLRPSAAAAAFANLRLRVKLGRRQYPTPEEWKKSVSTGKEQ